MSDYNNFPYVNKSGKDRIEEIKQKSDTNTVFTPYSINIKTLDKEIINFFKKDKTITFRGSVCPVYFIDNQRWVNLQKTWELVDENKNVERPYITIRQEEVSKGTRLGDNNKSTIPQQSTHRYIRVPDYDGSKTGFITYKIPQPTNIDITYELILHTNYLEEANLFVEHLYYHFNSLQAFIYPFNNYMPMVLENIKTEKKVGEEEERKIIKTATVKLKGFVIDKDKFEKVADVRRTSIAIEVQTTPKVSFEPIDYNELDFEIIHNPNDLEVEPYTINDYKRQVIEKRNEILKRNNLLKNIS
jgi:hypothetical protein